MSSKAEEMVSLLRAAAWQHVEWQSYRSTPSQVSLFIPQNFLAAVLGVHPLSVRRWFKKYRDLRQRVAYRRHFTSVLTASGGSRTVMDGCVFTVRLKGVSGREVRVPIEDLSHQYRNLQGDIDAGNTQAAGKGLFLSCSKTERTWDEKLDLIIRWLEKLRTYSPLNDANNLEEAFHSQEPRLISESLARVLQDQHSKLYWYRESSRWARKGRLSTFYGLVKRVLTDKSEQATRNPAALLIWRIKNAQKQQELFQA